jgi:hypothetical protein
MSTTARRIASFKAGRRFLLSLLILTLGAALFLPFRLAHAQFATPTVDGVIGSNEVTSGGRPASFLFFGYLASSGGYVYGQVPQSNPGTVIGTSAAYSHYYTVNNTANGASTKSFP